MGSFDKLEIGRRGLFAAQMGQRTTGHNIANVNTEGYKRQTIEQSEFVPEVTGILNGVNVDGIKRAQDEFIEQKILATNSDLKNEDTRAHLLRNLEVIFNDGDGRGLGHLITAHWAAWNELAVSPESLPLRQQLLESAQVLTEKFNTLHNQTRQLQKEIGGDIQNDIKDINRWAEEIGNLNQKIVMFEAQGKSANGLLNQRDHFANLISDKVSIQRSFNKNGRLHLQIGNGHTLVDGDKAFKLDIGSDQNSDNGIAIMLRMQENSGLDISNFTGNGTAGEKIRMINEYIPNVLGKLNDLADEIRFQVNKYYASGTPLYEPFSKMESTSDIPVEFVNGRISQLSSGAVTFKITDDDGDMVDTVQINLTQEDTAQSILEKINRVSEKNSAEGGKQASEYLQASFNGAKFQIAAKDNHKFYIAEDTTGAMAKLNVNAFFAGHYGALDMSVSPEFVKNSERIAAGEDMLPGNNMVALNIGDLYSASIMNEGTQTFDEFYDKLIMDMSLDLQTSKKRSEIIKETYDQYDTIREEVSGVNIDEEMTNLIRYQRAYEASAKFNSVADEMLKTAINM